MEAKRLRAIDLYSGIGGWSLGLRLAGIDVVASYERWTVANDTNAHNNGHKVVHADIRNLNLATLPSDIDLVVGSPPCTQFSFANRGGAGDLVDGMADIIRFFEIIDHLRPRLWVLENVPRAARLIEDALEDGGALAGFQHLNPRSQVFDMADFGLPQRRRRCLVGNINFEHLRGFAKDASPRTLGDIVTALDQDVIIDPLFGARLDRGSITDHEPEPNLDGEEIRINDANKRHHTVYNAMPFPDPLDRSVRTITATCTRVSRESVVIEPSPGCLRRLTLRERACLQAFPITYQFYGTTYSQKVRMIGNAIPPLFSYYVALSARDVAHSDGRALLKAASAGLAIPEALPPETPPQKPARRYPRDRTFRFAVPNLRLKSGVRFELTNTFEAEFGGWLVRFVFGTSKDIRSLSLGNKTLADITKRLPLKVRHSVDAKCQEMRSWLLAADLPHMQNLWAHRGPGLTRPFRVLDQLGDYGAAIIGILGEVEARVLHDLLENVLALAVGGSGRKIGFPKLLKNAPLVIAGLIVGAHANSTFTPKEKPRRRRKPDLAQSSRAAM